MTGNGTVVRLPDRPFADGWEQSPAKDDHAHQWETVYVEQHPGSFIELDRCESCHTPRCYRLDDRRTPCIERRHHDGLHIFESGMFEPVGGYLGPEQQESEAAS